VNSFLWDSRTHINSFVYWFGKFCQIVFDDSRFFVSFLPIHRAVFVDFLNTLVVSGFKNLPDIVFDS